MPTCPGCQQHVAHDRLDTHERYCHALRERTADRRRALRRLERRVEELDRRVDQRLRALEVAVGTRTPDAETGGQHLRFFDRDR